MKPNPHIADASEILIKVQMQQTPDGLGATTGQVRAEALQALADGLIAKMPEKKKLPEPDGEILTNDRRNLVRGFNNALDEVTKIIKDYFGVSDE